MHNFSKSYQLFLSKNFEFFNAFKKIEFKNNGLLKSNYSTPGTKFLVLFNNLDAILETLEKSKNYADKQISSVTQFIIDNLYSIDPFIASVIASEIGNRYHSLVVTRDNSNNQIEVLRNEINDLQKLLEDADLYDEYFESKINEQEEYIDSIAGDNLIEGETELLEELIKCQQSTTSGHIYIKHEIKMLTDEIHKLETNNATISQVHTSVADYISNLIDSLIRYHYYFDMFFGTLKKNELKKKDIAFFQTAFNVQFMVPNHFIYSCYENDKAILPLSSNLPEKKILENLDILKENNRIKYLDEYKIYSLNDLLSIYFHYFTQEKPNIRTCVNCGKYFIQNNKGAAKYCKNISPQNPSKTCKDIGADLYNKKKRNSNPITKEYTTTRNTLSKRVSRCNKDDAKQLKKVQKALEQFILNYEKQTKKYQTHKISEDEFVDWIISQK